VGISESTVSIITNSEHDVAWVSTYNPGPLLTLANPVFIIESKTAVSVVESATASFSILSNILILFVVNELFRNPDIFAIGRLTPAVAPQKSLVQTIPDLK
jgi:hypothetical protein